MKAYNWPTDREMRTAIGRADPGFQGEPPDHLIMVVSMYIRALGVAAEYGPESLAFKAVATAFTEGLVSGMSIMEHRMTSKLQDEVNEQAKRQAEEK